MNNRSLIVAAALGSSLLLGGCAAAVVGGGIVAAASYAHDRRTSGAIVEDQSIKAKINHVLSEDKELADNAHINVSSYNAIVLLSGETPSEEMRARAGELARSMDKVRRVNNEITIGAPTSASTRTHDAWITTKVKSEATAIAIEGFDPSRIKVVTENGSVFLMGLVSHQEADAITERARTVSGVKRIVKLFEYTD